MANSLSFLVHFPPGAPVAIAMLTGGVVRARRSGDLAYIWRRRTDWDALRRQLGYDSGPTAELPIPKIYPIRRPRLLGYWTIRTDWDEERAQLGYTGPDLQPPTPLPSQPSGGLMATLYRILVRLTAAWLVILSCLFALAATAGGADGFDARMAAIVILGPALIVGTIAWIIKPAT